MVTIGGPIDEVEGTRLSNLFADTYSAFGLLDAYTSEYTGAVLASAEANIGQTAQHLFTSDGKLIPGTYNFTSADSAYLNFLAEADYGLSNCRNDGFGGALTSITIAVAPEPSAWALMISGFGAIGAVMRRRWSAGRRVSG
jgi:hypothetical protein